MAVLLNVACGNSILIKVCEDQLISAQRSAPLHIDFINARCWRSLLCYLYGHHPIGYAGKYCMDVVKLAYFPSIG